MGIRVTCRHCNGSGEHKKCDGDGWYWGGLFDFSKIICKDCNRTGRCPHCQGRGFFFVRNRNKPPFRPKF